MSPTDDDRLNPITGVVAIALALFLTLALVLACFAGFGAVGRWNKERNLQTNRKDITIEAQAQADAQEARDISGIESADRQAQADIIRAQGQAESNEILQTSLTPEYLQYLFVTTMADSNAQLIYVPMNPDGTFALPTAEAGRAVVPQG